MKIFLIVLLLIILGVAAFWFFAPKNSPIDYATVPAGVSCEEGLNGNKGDNFCSNYHGGSSQCLGSGGDIYPDGCSK